jgi:hypothetical protein
MPHSLSKGEADGRKSPVHPVVGNLRLCGSVPLRPVIDMGVRWALTPRAQIHGSTPAHRGGGGPTCACSPPRVFWPTITYRPVDARTPAYVQPVATVECDER